MIKILFIATLVASQLIAIGNTNYDHLFEKYSKINNIPSGFLKQVATYESNLDHNAEKKTFDGVGKEVGLFLMNTKYHPEVKIDGFNPEVNIRVAAKLAGGCIKAYGKTEKMIECFNRYPEKNVEVLMGILKSGE